MVHGDNSNGDTSELRDGAGLKATLLVQRSFGNLGFVWTGYSFAMYSCVPLLWESTVTFTEAPVF